MKFSKEFLLDEEWDELISGRVVDQGRWTTTYERIFKYKDKFYRTFFDRGSTEMQDCYPYEYEGNEIECKEVKPVEKLIIVYEEV